MQEAVIIDCFRTAVGKSGRGTLKNTRPDDMAAAVFDDLLRRHPQVNKAEIDDVILGCANPEAESGMNMARVAALRAGLPDTVPGVTINRFCSSGLQAIAMAAEKIRSGGAEIIIAGRQRIHEPAADVRPQIRAESLDGGSSFRRSTWAWGLRPKKCTGNTTSAAKIRTQFSYRSHQNALKAQAEGRFDDEIVPLEVDTTTTPREPRRARLKKTKARAPIRRSKRWRKLRPVFHAAGTVTAGNSSQTSDGAAAAIVMSEKKARELGLKPMARFVSFAVGGVPPEIMGIGPIVAIPKALKLAGLKLGRHRLGGIE